MKREELIDALKRPGELQASLAMKELLEREDLLEIIGEQQDTSNPLLRRRIQQLSSLFNRRFIRKHLGDVIEGEEYDAWDLFCQLNVCIDQQTSLQQLNDFLDEILLLDQAGFSTPKQFCDFMREQKFQPDPGINRCVVANLVSDVLFNRMGAPLLLAVIGARMALLHGIKLKIGFVGEMPMLQDEEGHLIHPADNWNFADYPEGDFIEAGKKELGCRMLALCFQAATLEQLHTVAINCTLLMAQISII